MMETISLISIIAVTAVLVSASIQDLRTREVSDIHWLIVGIMGISVIIFTAGDDVTVGRIMICAGCAMILFDILHDREWRMNAEIAFYAITASMFIVPLIFFRGDAFVTDMMTIPVCYVIFVLLFYSGAIKGGADVKCLITLALLFPVYPMFFGYPLIEPLPMIQNVISFPLAVLFHAALMSVMPMIPLILRNIIRKDTKLPNMLTGYRMSAEDADKAHVWVTSDVTDGKVWVTPKIPFIIPITVAVLFVAFVGNILFLI
jgi:preflagellin peptidase FlaK